MSRILNIPKKKNPDDKIYKNLKPEVWSQLKHILSKYHIDLPFTDSVTFLTKSFSQCQPSVRTQTPHDHEE